MILNIMSDYDSNSIGYALSTLKQKPAISSGPSWGTWIRTKILSSRETCTAIVRFPNTAGILPSFPFFVVEFTMAFTT